VSDFKNRRTCYGLFTEALPAYSAHYDFLYSACEDYILHFGHTKIRKCCKDKTGRCAFGRIAWKPLPGDFDVFRNYQQDWSGEVEMLQSQVVIAGIKASCDLASLCIRKVFLHKQELVQGLPFQDHLAGTFWTKEFYDSTVINDRFHAWLFRSYWKTLPKKNFLENWTISLQPLICISFVKINDSLLKKDPFTELTANMKSSSIQRTAWSRDNTGYLGRDGNRIRKCLFCGLLTNAQPVAETSADIVNTFLKHTSMIISKRNLPLQTLPWLFWIAKLKDYSEKLKDAEKSIEGFREDQQCGKSETGNRNRFTQSGWA